MVLKVLLGVIVGGGLGFAYYYFIGCYSGTCPIQSNPYVATLYGSALGFVITFF